MQASSHYRGVGVDGCAGGWFLVALEADGRWDMVLASGLASLISRFTAADRVLVDIPIGLPDSQPRECDRAARRRLGRPRAASVFPVPCRAAVTAADYRAACRLNQRALGRALTRQTWNICAKIAAMDAFLDAHPGLRPQVREAHPEVVFQALNGGTAIVAPKRSEAGRARRLAVLEGWFGDAGALLTAALERFPRSLLAADDVLDALALAVAAWLSRPLASLPAEPPRDERGLPMEIVYPLIEG